MCIWLIKTCSGFQVFQNLNEDTLPKAYECTSESLGEYCLVSLLCSLLQSSSWGTSQEAQPGARYGLNACRQKHSIVVFISHLGQMLNGIKALLEHCFILKDILNSLFIVNLKNCMWCSQVIVINPRASVHVRIYLDN